MKKKYIALFLCCAQSSVFAQVANVKVQDIEVIGHQEGSSLVDFIPSVTKLQGKELQQKRQTSLGDTLKDEAGVTSTQFGPSASRPVIRGLDGARIRVLQNSLGTLDASTQSLDHAIPVDTLTLDSIEIVRGPMSLIYGSSAVGGVVNLVTNKIHDQFEKGLHSSILTQSETVNNGVSTGAVLDYGSKGWMYHFDGSTRNLQDQKIPADARSNKKQASDPLAAGKKEANGTLPNSFNRQDSLSGGISKIFNKGSIGVSYNLFNTTYGTVAEENVSIKMNQKRYELHGDYKLEGTTFSKIRVKAAQSTYDHKEIEDGNVGTEFKNDGNEIRLELLNHKYNIDGISGLQSQNSKFSASGDEAFLPVTQNNNLAVFTYQELRSHQHTFSLGGRLETAKVKKHATTGFGDAKEKNSSLSNASAGYQYKFNQNNSLSTSLSYTERNANFQELYAKGAHIATGTFEQGNENLNKERAYALEVSYKRETKDQKTVLNLYTQQFKDFIFLSKTGTNDAGSGLPKYLYKSVDATFYGADLENKSRLGIINDGQVHLVNRFDIVRAKNTTDNQGLPRISPPRVGIALQYTKNRWTTDLDIKYVSKQIHTAPNETNTPEYTLTNIGYSYDFIGNTYGINAFARVRNLFDITARNHVSILKQISPLPGRNLIVGLQMQF